MFRNGCKSSRWSLVLLMLGAFAVAVPVQADLISTAWTELQGIWTPGTSGTGQFRAIASNDPAGDGSLPGTFGIVSRTVTPFGNDAVFNRGFVGNSIASYTMTMNLENITATSADVGANSTVVIVGGQGNILTAAITGSWSNLLGVRVFTGRLDPIAFSQAGQFDQFFGAGPGGAATTGFSTDFSSFVLPLNGDFQDLGFGGSNLWFDDPNSFLANTTMTAQIIPAPGALLLGAIGLGAIGLVRRRLAR